MRLTIRRITHMRRLAQPAPNPTGSDSPRHHHAFIAGQIYTLVGHPPKPASSTTKTQTRCVALRTMPGPPYCWAACIELTYLIKLYCYLEFQAKFCLLKVLYHQGRVAEVAARYTLQRLYDSCQATIRRGHRRKLEMLRMITDIYILNRSSFAIHQIETASTKVQIVAFLRF